MYKSMCILKMLLFMYNLVSNEKNQAEALKIDYPVVLIFAKKCGISRTTFLGAIQFYSILC